MSLLSRLWQEDPGFPEEIFQPAGMLGRPERRMLYSLGRYAASGNNSIVDAGAFLGASAFALAAGLRDASYSPNRVQVHSYDYFRVVDEYVRRSISENVRTIDFGDSYLDIFQDQVNPVGPWVKAYAGDFLQHDWQDGDIDILFVDIAKTNELHNHFVTKFLPSLRVGGYMIQQDFNHCWHPYIHTTVAYLSDHFETVDPLVPYQSHVSRLISKIPDSKIEKISAGFGDEAFPLLDRLIAQSDGQLVGMLRTARVWEAHRQRDEDRLSESLESFSECIDELEPGLWNGQLDKVLEQTDRTLNV